MKTVDSHESSDAAAPPVSDLIELRVLKSGIEVARYPLAQGKSTVGSSPSCQVRLAAGAARPLQCLIVRDGQDTTVTRWAAGIQLNDLDFATASMHFGDVLSIGDLKLELVGPAAQSHEFCTVEDSPVALIDAVEAQVAAEVAIAEIASAEREDRSAIHDADVAKLHAANQQARQRFRRLVSALRELRDEARGLDQHVNELTEQLLAGQKAQEQLTAQLHQSQAIAAERESQYGEELDRAIAELTASYGRADAAEQELQSLRANNQLLHEQLDLLSAELEQLRDDSNRRDSEKQRFEHELADREAQLAQLRSDFEQLQHNLQISSAELQAENDALQRQLVNLQDEREREVAALQDGLEASVSELHQQNEDLRGRLSDLSAERDRQLGELRDYGESVRNESAVILAERDNELMELRDRLGELSAERDRQVKELGELNDSLRHELTTIVAQSDSELLELRSRLSDVSAERDRQLNEAHELNKSLRNDYATLLAERETSVQELQLRNEALMRQLEDGGVEHDKALADLQLSRDAESANSRQQIESLHNQLASAAAEHEQQIASLQTELEQARQAAHEAELRSSIPDPARIELEDELNAVRSERQLLAEANLKLTARAEEAEKHSRLLDIDVRSVNAEWQRAQSTVARLQDELLTARAHAEDLDAKLADFQSAAEVARAADCDQYIRELADVRAQLEVREQALVETQSDNERLLTQLEASRQEFDSCQHKIAALEAEVSGQPTTTARLEHEIAEHVAAIAERDAEIVTLRQEADRIQKATADEVASREERIAKLSAELDNIPSIADARISELTTSLKKLEEQYTAELCARESRIEELSAAFEKQQVVQANEIAARDARIADLADELARLTEQAVNLDTRQLRDEDLESQLRLAEENASREISLREKQLADTVQELHETQDKLAECAAQGERLNEHYVQAQADLSALTAMPLETTDSPNIETDLLALEADLDPEPQVTAQPRSSDDPRDSDAPRLERALASLATETEPNELLEPSAEYQPESFIDRYSHIFEQDDHAVTVPLVTNSETQPASEICEIAGDDSAALEAYMANMMKRVRGEVSSDAIVPPVSRESDVEHAAPLINPVTRMNTLTQRVTAPGKIESAAVEEEGLIDLHELRQSSQKPPLPTSLSAMRELANISARQAIAKHRKRRHFERALGKLLVSGIAGGTAAFMLLTADDLLSPYFFAGCAVAVVSGYWGMKLLGILLEIIRDGINDDITPAELTETEDPLPIDGVSTCEQDGTS